MNSNAQELFFDFILPNYIGEDHGLFQQPWFLTNSRLQLDVLKLCCMEKMFTSGELEPLDENVDYGFLDHIVFVHNTNTAFAYGSVDIRKYHLREQAPMMVSDYGTADFNEDFLDTLVSNIPNGKYLIGRSWFHHNIDIHLSIMALKLLNKDTYIDVKAVNFEEHLIELMLQTLIELQVNAMDDVDDVDADTADEVDADDADDVDDDADDVDDDADDANDDVDDADDVNDVEPPRTQQCMKGATHEENDDTIRSYYHKIASHSIQEFVQKFDVSVEEFAIKTRQMYEEIAERMIQDMHAMDAATTLVNMCQLR